MSNPIRRSAPRIAEADLADLERTIGHPLPAAYRAFLFASNGGVPRRSSFRYSLSSGKTRKARVVAFAPTSTAGWAEVGSRSLAELWETDGREPIGGTIAVGAAETDVNAGTIRLGVAGDAAGRVFFRPEDTAREQLYPVAADWVGFIEGLTQTRKPEPWDEPIEDGDTEALHAWLRGHRRKWDDGGSRVEIERKAVEENQKEILVMLVDHHDFEPASIVVEALDAHRLDLALHFVPASDPKRLGSALNRPGPHLWHAPPVVAALLDAGADAAAEGDGGLTPLHHAARAGSAESVRLLLDQGADPTLADDEGQTPRDLAEQSEWADVAALLRAAESNRPEDDDTQDVRPFDLCGVRFERTGQPITLEEILAVEEALKLAFPPEYRWLLTQANGAILRPGLLPMDVLPELYPTNEDEDDVEDEDEDDEDPGNKEGPEIRLDLYPLRQADCPEDEPGFDEEAPSLNCSAQEMVGWYHDGSEIPRGCLPIGGLAGFGCEGSGFLLLGCRGSRRGKLFAFDYHETPLDLTLPELFARLALAGRRPKSPAERLADAVEAGDIAGVKSALADGAAKTWMARDGRMPLRAACEKGFDEAVRLIGEATVDRGQAITEALMAGRLAVARLLFDATPKLKRDALESILFYPAVFADIDFLAAVVARGVRLEKMFKDKHSRSPLEVAAMSGSVAGLTFLLDRGGNLGHVDHEHGTTLLHEAVGDPKVDVRAMIAFLLERGVPLNAGDGRGHTALHAAIRANHPEAARALIDTGADMSYRAAQYSPMMDDPRTKKMLARAEKELQKLAREMDREFPDVSLDDEDAPMLDPDASGSQTLAELMGLAGQMQEAARKMLPNAAEHLNRVMQALGPAAADLAQTCPYPHVPALIEELNRYAAEKRAAGR